MDLCVDFYEKKWVNQLFMCKISSYVWIYSIVPTHKFFFCSLCLENPVYRCHLAVGTSAKSGSNPSITK